MSSIAIQTFYKFLDLPTCLDLQPILKEECLKRDIKGTILLATEGINATLAGDFNALTEMIAFIQERTPIGHFPVKHAQAITPPFSKIKVRVKREIVTMGVPEIKPHEKTGTFVSWSEWNQLLDDPDTIVIDTRNEYEIELGTFEKSINPKTLTFKEFPKYVKENASLHQYKKVAMCCTGGIRCEKASAYMLENGFDEIFHLEGGILKYLEDVPDAQNKWKGDCFVFDDRVSVTETLSEGGFGMCTQCFEAKPASKPYNVNEFVCIECIEDDLE